MMMLWAWAGVPLGVYNIVEDFNVALRIQPQILTLLSLTTWIQCLYYEKVRVIGPIFEEPYRADDDYKKWSLLHSLIVVTPIACMMGGIQAALIIALRIAKDRNLQWPLTLMAALSAALLAAGVLRHYWDIYVHRTVRGISFLFVAIDAAGDVFSLVSVVFQPSLDVLGLVIYGTELVLWIGVFACGGYYNFVPWVTERLQKSNEVIRSSNALSSACSRNSNENSAAMAAEEPIALHDLPSSPSVFRTPSGELEAVRQRTSRSKGEVMAGMEQ